MGQGGSVAVDAIMVNGAVNCEFVFVPIQLARGYNSRPAIIFIVSFWFCLKLGIADRSRSIVL